MPIVLNIRVGEAKRNGKEIMRVKYVTEFDQNNDCCGNGPHSYGTVRVMSSGGDSNLILCRSCWNRELAYRRERNTSLEAFARYDLPAWDSAKVYRRN